MAHSHTKTSCGDWSRRTFQDGSATTDVRCQFVWRDFRVVFVVTIAVRPFASDTAPLKRWLKLFPTMRRLAAVSPLLPPFKTSPPIHHARPAMSRPVAHFVPNFHQLLAQALVEGHLGDATPMGAAAFPWTRVHLLLQQCALPGHSHHTFTACFGRIDRVLPKSLPQQSQHEDLGEPTLALA